VVQILGRERQLGSDRYQVLGEIARGGVGVVYKGRDVDLGRDVAMKILHAELARDRGILQRFVEEAQIGGQLQHPGIVPVYEIGLQADERPFFAMKLVKGQTLSALLKRRASPADDRRKLLAIFEQVCQTMAYAHARSVVHRDLKPSNVMVGAFGEVQVVDWGFAKVLRTGGAADDRERDTTAEPHSAVETVRTAEDGSESLAGSVIGTPAYMPPEQARGDVEHMDERSDVFSLGAMLCEILTGQPPYTKEQGGDLLAQAARARLEPALARLEACGADPDLVAIAVHCLVSARQARPADAGVLAGEIQGYLAAFEQRVHTSELAAAEAKGVARQERRARKLTTALAASLVGIVLVAGGSWAVLERAAHATQLGFEREAQLALGEALQLAGRAGALPAGESAAIYSAAVDAASRAERAFEAAGSEETPAADARDLRVDLEKKQREARARSVRLARQAALLERLTEARLPSQDEQVENPKRWHVRWARELDAELTALFRAHDLDVDARPTAELAAELSGEDSLAFAAALDDWAFKRRQVVVAGEAPRRLDSVRPLIALAGALDPDDALRNELREAIGRPEADGSRFVEQVESFDPASHRSTTVLLLGMWLGKDYPEVAIDLLRRGQLQYPDSFWLNFQLGLLFDTTEPPRPEEATKYYGAAFSLAPRFSEVARRLARLYSLTNELEAAQRYAERAVELAPRAATPRCDLGSIWSYLGDRDRAQREFESALSLDPLSVLAHFNLGNLDVQRGDSEGARKWFLEVLDLDPEYAPAHVELALLCEEDGDREGAERHQQAARSLGLERPLALTRMGLLLRKQGDLAGARRSLERAIELSPHSATSASSYNGLGMVLQAQGDRSGARRCFEKAIELSTPRHYAAHVNLGELLRLEGELERAQELLETAIDRKPDLSVGHYNLGIVLANRGDVPGAMARYREALRLDPACTKAHVNLANILRRQGDHEAAREHLRQAAEVNPSLWQAHGSLGISLMMAGEDSEARACFQRAVEVGPSPVYVLYNLAGGLVANSCGQLSDDTRVIMRTQALESLHTALEMYRSGQHSDRRKKAVADMMGRWLTDEELQGAWSEAALESLPPDERAAWKSLREEVETTWKLMRGEE
jgi:serine/threonine-protein kinase